MTKLGKRPALVAIVAGCVVFLMYTGYDYTDAPVVTDEAKQLLVTYPHQHSNDGSRASHQPTMSCDIQLSAAATLCKKEKDLERVWSKRTVDTRTAAHFKELTELNEHHQVKVTALRSQHNSELADMVRTAEDLQEQLDDAQQRWRLAANTNKLATITLAPAKPPPNDAEPRAVATTLAPLKSNTQDNAAAAAAAPVGDTETVEVDPALPSWMRKKMIGQVEFEAAATNAPSKEEAKKPDLPANHVDDARSLLLFIYMFSLVP
jgi:hypothetical protein